VGGGGCGGQGGGRGDSPKWQSNDGSGKEGGAAAFFDGSNTPVGSGDDGVTLQHIVNVWKVRRHPKQVKSLGWQRSPREVGRRRDGSKSDVPGGGL
jgi:hypothetical protein